jgi:hypothetical protein
MAVIKPQRPLMGIDMNTGASQPATGKPARPTGGFSGRPTRPGGLPFNPGQQTANPAKPGRTGGNMGTGAATPTRPMPGWGDLTGGIDAGKGGKTRPGAATPIRPMPGWGDLTGGIDAGKGGKTRPGMTGKQGTTPVMPTLKPGEIATPEQMRQMAEAMYNPAYQQALDSLSAQETSLGTQRTRMQEDTNRTVTDEMIKRGMGRSDQFGDRLTQGLADVEQDYLSALENIGTQRNTLGATYEQSVKAGMLDLMKYYEGMRQFNADMALREKAMKGGGGGGRGGGGGFTGLDAQGNYLINGVIVRPASTNADWADRGGEDSTSSGGQIGKPTYTTTPKRPTTGMDMNFGKPLLRNIRR